MGPADVDVAQVEDDDAHQAEDLEQVNALLGFSEG